MNRVYLYLPSRARSLQKGFTLLELLIVLVVIGVAAGIAGLMVARDLGGLELRTTTKNISAVLRYARNHAVSEKKEYVFEIDEEEKVYRLLTEKEKKTSPDDEAENDTDDTEVDTTVYDDEGKAIVISKDIPDRLEVTFHENDDEFPVMAFSPQGNSSGGVIEVSNDRGKTFFIVVNRITGRVVIEEAD